MKAHILIIFLFSIYVQLFAQIDPWKIKARISDTAEYYGITVANGMIGLVSSDQPLKVKDVILAGTYDLYGRGRVSNFLNSFNLLNMQLDINGKTMDARSVKNFTQELDMRSAAFTGAFDCENEASVTYTCYSLRHLPFSVLMEVTIKAKKDITIQVANRMESPDALRDVQNYYNELDRPHVNICLLTSTAKSPTGKLKLCASTTYLFEEDRLLEPRVIHEMWDNNMHLMKFSKTVKAGQTYSYCIVGTSISSAHHEDPLNEAERLTIFAKLEGRDKLIGFH